MKYQEEIICSKDELKNIIKKTFSDLFANNIVVEGQRVEVPSDRSLSYKIKYSADEEGASLTIKLSWDNVVDELELNEDEEF